MAKRQKRRANKSRDKRRVELASNFHHNISAKYVSTRKFYQDSIIFVCFSTELKSGGQFRNCRFILSTFTPPQTQLTGVAHQRKLNKSQQKQATNLNHVNNQRCLVL